MGSIAHVLVTGGAGYVGSHTCLALSRAGFVPVTYDDLSTGHRSNVKWGPLVEGTLADAVRLGAAIDEYKPVGTIHFAGFIAVGESVVDPGRYYANNVGATLVLLEALRKKNVGPVIFSSTAAVYGDPLETPIPESHRLAPVSPYGHSKRMIEQVIADYGAAYGMGYALLRYFNAAGADPDGQLGEAHEPETHLIPKAIASVRTNRPLDIFGTDYDTRDGTAVRDYIHVSDLADAHVRALQRLRAHPSDAMVLNVGTGIGHTVSEVVAKIAAVAGQPLSLHHAPRRPGDPPVLVASATQIGRLLAFAPRHSSLEEIVTTAWNWHGQCD